jgi:hypothetical protein
LERVAIKTAVAMKYSSQLGRRLNFFVACAIRSTGLFLAALMGRWRTLHAKVRRGNLRLSEGPEDRAPDPIAAVAIRTQPALCSGHMEILDPVGAPGQRRHPACN